MSKRILLLNSAIMPIQGIYEIRKISKDQFIRLIQFADKYNILDSYIGYDQTVNYIEGISGVRVPINRTQAVPNTGDYFLVIKLTKRVSNPIDKGKIDKPEYEYYFGVYYGNKYIAESRAWLIEEYEKLETYILPFEVTKPEVRIFLNEEYCKDTERDIVIYYPVIPGNESISSLDISKIEKGVEK